MDDVSRLSWIKGYYSSMNYPIKEFNLFGIRFPRAANKDKINDFLGYFTDDEIFITVGTTKPGVDFVNKPEGVAGVFTLMEGRHERIWSPGFHGSDKPESGLKRHAALVNNSRYCKCTKGWRDINKNYVYDDGDIVVCDYFAVNFHCMGQVEENRSDIRRMSAGCQVVRSKKDFEKIIAKFKNIYKSLGNAATTDYVLFKSTEIPDGFV